MGPPATCWKRHRCRSCWRTDPPQSPAAQDALRRCGARFLTGAAGARRDRAACPGNPASRASALPGAGRHPSWRAGSGQGFAPARPASMPGGRLEEPACRAASFVGPQPRNAVLRPIRATLPSCAGLHHTRRVGCTVAVGLFRSCRSGGGGTAFPRAGSDGSLPARHDPGRGARTAQGKPFGGTGICSLRGSGAARLKAGQWAGVIDLNACPAPQHREARRWQISIRH